MQPRSQAFVFLATSSMQIQRRRTQHLQWGDEYGRKKKEKSMRGNTGPLTQTLHYIDTALQLLQPLVLGQTYKSAEDSSQDTTSYVPSSVYLTLHHYSICKWKQSNTDGSRWLGMNQRCSIPTYFHCRTAVSFLGCFYMQSLNLVYRARPILSLAGSQVRPALNFWLARELVQLDRLGLNYTTETFTPEINLCSLDSLGPAPSAVRSMEQHLNSRSKNAIKCSWHVS